MGVCLADTFFRIGRYVWEANKESSPLIKKKEAAPEPAAVEVPAVEEPVTGEPSDEVPEAAGLSGTADTSGLTQNGDGDEDAADAAGE
jgi:hypothetical protein